MPVVLDQPRCVVGEQGVDGGFRQQPAAGDGAPVHDHLEEPGVVQGRARQASAPSAQWPIRSEGVVGGVVRVAVGLPCARRVFFPDLDQVGLLLLGKHEMGVVHAERVEQLSAQEVGVGLAGGIFDNGHEHDDPQAVVPVLAG